MKDIDSMTADRNELLIKELLTNLIKAFNAKRYVIQYRYIWTSQKFQEVETKTHRVVHTNEIDPYEAYVFVKIALNNCGKSKTLIIYEQEIDDPHVSKIKYLKYQIKIYNIALKSLDAWETELVESALKRMIFDTSRYLAEELQRVNMAMSCGFKVEEPDYSGRSNYK